MEFHQTDAGSGVRGLMQKTPDACGVAAIHGRFTVTLSGSGTPFRIPGLAGPVSAKGTVIADGAGGLEFTWSKRATRGSYSVDSECFVELEFGLPAEDGESTALVKLRGILTAGGREILAVQTGPERVARARFTR